MKINWSATIRNTSAIVPAAVVRIVLQTEHEIFVTQSTYERIKNSLAEAKLADVAATLPILFDVPVYLRELISTPLTSIENPNITFEDIERIVQADYSLKVFTEGSPASGMNLCIQQGGRVQRIPINEANLPKLQEEFKKETANLATQTKSPFNAFLANAIVGVLTAVAAAAAAYETYRVIKEIERQHEEERRLEQEMKMNKEAQDGAGIRETRDDGDISMGGPAADRLMDLGSRAC